MVFPVVMYGCESWTIKKAEHRKTDAFELWCWRRLLRIAWTARRSNQSILKEISPGCSLEGLMLKLKLQFFGHLMGRVGSLKRPWCLEGLGAGGEGDDRGWHHRPNGHWFRGIPGVGDGQRGLTCCGSWGHKELDTTERLNWIELKFQSVTNSWVSGFLNRNPGIWGIVILATIDLFTISIVISFPDCHLTGIYTVYSLFRLSSFT